MIDKVEIDWTSLKWCKYYNAKWGRIATNRVSNLVCPASHTPKSAAAGGGRMGACPIHSIDIKYTGYTCSTFGNCEGTVNRASQRPRG